MEYEKIYKDMTKTSDIVKDILEKHPNTRDNDFILYAWVLYYKKIALKQPLGEFLKTATDQNAPPFATITKCRRTLQSDYPELKGKKVNERNSMQMVYKLYNKIHTND